MAIATALLTAAALLGWALLWPDSS